MAQAVCTGMEQVLGHPRGAPVVNAIKHGNQNDQSKRVIVEFSVEPRDHMIVRVEDQGTGFDTEDIPDPLAPENIMKGSGRGILFMRNYMDDVSLTRHPEGGMQIWMIKRAAQAQPQP